MSKMKDQDKENIRNLSPSETYSAVISVKWDLTLDNASAIVLGLSFLWLVFHCSINDGEFSKNANVKVDSSKEGLFNKV